MAKKIIKNEDVFVEDPVFEDEEMDVEAVEDPVFEDEEMDVEAVEDPVFEDEEMDVEAVDAEDEAITDTEKERLKKEKKADAARRFKERKAEKEKKVSEFAKWLDTFLRDRDITLPEEQAEMLNSIAHPQAKSTRFSYFNELFGDNPKVGDSVTLMDVFKKTYKAKAYVDAQVKKWAVKGIIVEFKQAPIMYDSTYTIIAMN